MEKLIVERGIVLEYIRLIRFSSEEWTVRVVRRGENLFSCHHGICGAFVLFGKLEFVILSLPSPDREQFKKLFHIVYPTRHEYQEAGCSIGWY